MDLMIFLLIEVICNMRYMQEVMLSNIPSWWSIQYQVNNSREVENSHFVEAFLWDNRLGVLNVLLLMILMLHPCFPHRVVHALSVYGQEVRDAIAEVPDISKT